MVERTDASCGHHRSRILVRIDLIENFEPRKLKSPATRWLSISGPLFCPRATLRLAQLLHRRRNKQKRHAIRVPFWNSP
jgi:hypothetical protein